MTHFATDTSLPVFTAHDVGDVLAAVPTFFGFTPADSFVALAASGPRHRFGFRMRFDLVDGIDVGHAAALVAHHLGRNRADGAILLALTPHRRLGEAMCRAALAALPAQIEPVVVAWADGTHYWEPVPGFPAEGIGYEMSPHHLAVVQAVMAGQEIVADRETLAARFAGCSGSVAAAMSAVVGEELPRVVSAFGACATDDDLVGTALADLDPIFAVALADGERLSDRQVAVASLWLASAAVRDEVCSRIDRDHARDWLRLMVDLAGRVVPPFEPSVLSLAGFAAWMVGDGAQALIALDRAIRADPDHRLTRLLREVVARGISPDEYQRRCAGDAGLVSAWQTGSRG
ncbi:MAG: DUF4192 domain-containing protein [Aeromicrobium sp.]|uniref:DUF4192 domain-containing protein n=1 Tax=Aeromicrobium sp. TaxID=1871063 RepID=UPI0039E31890